MRVFYFCSVVDSAGCQRKIYILGTIVNEKSKTVAEERGTGEGYINNRFCGKVK